MIHWYIFSFVFAFVPEINFLRNSERAFYLPNKVVQRKSET